MNSISKSISRRNPFHDKINLPSKSVFQLHRYHDGNSLLTEKACHNEFNFTARFISPSKIYYDETHSNSVFSRNNPHRYNSISCIHHLAISIRHHTVPSTTTFSQLRNPFHHRIISITKFIQSGYRVHPQMMKGTHPLRVQSRHVRQNSTAPSQTRSAHLLRLLLMLAPSLSLAPVAPVDLARSDPARSTRFILAKVLLVSSVASFWWTCAVSQGYANRR